MGNARAGNETPVICPHCKSVNTTHRSLFGSRLMSSMYKCEDCMLYFDKIRWIPHKEKEMQP
jgi:transposase-like protein